MAAPALVFNEPAATGALRVELHGDPARAGAQLGAARALLGSLRCMYGVNERIAAGEPGGFYARQVLLPDGTRIEALTNHGLDIVRIHAAPVDRPADVEAVAPRPPVLRPVLRARKRVLLVGADANNTALFWREGDAGPTAIPVPYGNASLVTAVAANGVVAGTASDSHPYVSPTYTAFRWSAEAGSILLGPTGRSFAGPIANDGSVIGGSYWIPTPTDFDPNTVWTGACYWDADGGFHPLPALWAGLNTYSNCVAVANGGRRMIIYTEYTYVVDDTAVADNALITISAGGNTTVLVRKSGLHEVAFYPAVVSANGAVVAWSEYPEGSIVPTTYGWSEESGRFTVGGGLAVSGISPDGRAIYLTDTNLVTSYRWTAAGGLRPIDAAGNAAYCGADLAGEGDAMLSSDQWQSCEAFGKNSGELTVLRDGAVATYQPGMYIQAGAIEVVPPGVIETVVDGVTP